MKYFQVNDFGVEDNLHEIFNKKKHHGEYFSVSFDEAIVVIDEYLFDNGYKITNTDTNERTAS